MVTKKLGLKRLEKLRDWMRGKGSGRKFDFGTYEDACGTASCLAGELPYLFPKYWGFSAFCSSATGKFIFLKEKPKEKERMFNTSQPTKKLAQFFHISLSEAKHLFVAGCQQNNIDPYYEKHAKLTEVATKKEVLENLERFIKIKKDEEIKKGFGKAFRKYGEESKVGREELMKVEEKRLFIELRNNHLKGEIKLLKKRNEELRKIIEGFEERNKTVPLKEITTKTEEVDEKLKNEINYELNKDKIKEIYNTTPAKTTAAKAKEKQVKVKDETDWGVLFSDNRNTPF